MHNDRKAMVYRLEKGQPYLKAGTPLAHFDHHCVVDRRYALHVYPVGRGMIKEVVNAVIEVEKQRLKNEMGKDAIITVIFDGTTRRR